MDELLIVFIAGFAASFVDGALGMGFGPASSSILLGTGHSPAAVSTTVNLAKVATGLSSAISHWKFRNIDLRLVRRLAIPGCAGALIGVTVLANVDGDQLKPVLTVVLLVMAARILLRFSRPLPVKSDETEPRSTGQRVRYDERGTVLAATAGGLTNGLVGSWGPVVTTFLLQKGVTPRYAVGSANTAEIAVALVASGSLLVSVGGGGINLAVVAAMLAGGILAAPVAAWTVRFIPARGLGVTVGGLLLLTNIRQLSESLGLGGIRWIVYGLAFVACGVATMRPRLALRRAAASAAS